jgi:hypothetical protein
MISPRMPSLMPGADLYPGPAGQEYVACQHTARHGTFIRPPTLPP